MNSLPSLHGAVCGGNKTGKLWFLIWWLNGDASELACYYSSNNFSSSFYFSDIALNWNACNLFYPITIMILYY